MSLDALAKRVNSWVEVTIGVFARRVDSTQLAHERNEGTSNQFGVGVDESTIKVLNGTSAVILNAGAPSLLFSIRNNNTGVATATVVGMVDQNGAAVTQVYSLAANEVIEFKGAKFNTSLSVQPSVSNVLAVESRPQS